MRAPHAYRGFTLIELIAAMTIMAIVAAIALPRVTAATPFQERGYADVVTASLRQSRQVAMATGCDVEFTIDADGYRALQRAATGVATGLPCVTVGAFTVPVTSGMTPPGIAPAVNRTITFLASGVQTGATTTVNIGPQVITIDAGGLVQGP
jgi:prepilin-type N-terminal cleavage/methylation domain-containing protein